MRVAIVGSRNYPDLDAVAAYVKALPAGTIVVSGGAPGVDTVAERTALARGLKVDVYWPEWGRYGKQAGFLRNTTIVQNCDRVVAFHYQNSAGTADTIKKAKFYGRPVEVITCEETPPVAVQLDLFGGE